MNRARPLSVGSAKLAFSSNGDGGDITFVRERSADVFVATGSVATQPRSKTMALDPVSHRLFVHALIGGNAQVTPSTKGTARFLQS